MTAVRKAAEAETIEIIFEIEPRPPVKDGCVPARAASPQSTGRTEKSR